jgi:asparagine N-glycosylation enzyme membrane subunit Stt3
LESSCQLSRIEQIRFYAGTSKEIDMRWFLIIGGVLLILVGIVWFFQGINVLLGSFMSGNSLYAVLGGVLVVIGGLMLYFSNRMRRSNSDE